MSPNLQIPQPVSLRWMISLGAARYLKFDDGVAHQGPIRKLERSSDDLNISAVRIPR
jgi:hypothetical protein